MSKAKTAKKAADVLGDVLARQASKSAKKLDVIREPGELLVKSSHGQAAGRQLGDDEIEYMLEDLAPKIKDPMPTYLDHLEVNPEARGQGHGSDLLKQFIKEAKKDGSKEVILNASPLSMDREEAYPKLLDFYKKHGFEILKEYPEHHNAMMRKKLALMLAAGGLGGASQSWADDIQNPIDSGVKTMGDSVGNVLDTVDKYTGRPIRAAAQGLLKGKNPFTEALESVIKDRQVTGNDVAHSLLEKNPSLGIPTPEGGREYPAEDMLGLAADVALDPTNMIPVGAAKNSPKILKTMRRLIK